MDSLSLDEIKGRLKQWETSYYRENKKKPGKDDIKNASEDIRNLYKKYTTLKNQTNPWDTRLPSSTAEKSISKKTVENSTKKLTKNVISKMKENIDGSAKFDKRYVAPRLKSKYELHPAKDATIEETNQSIDTKEDVNNFFTIGKSISKSMNTTNFGSTTSTKTSFELSKKSGTFLKRNISFNILSDDEFQLKSNVERKSKECTVKAADTAHLKDGATSAGIKFSSPRKLLVSSDRSRSTAKNDGQTSTANLMNDNDFIDDIPLPTTPDNNSKNVVVRKSSRKRKLSDSDDNSNEMTSCEQKKTKSNMTTGVVTRPSNVSNHKSTGSSGNDNFVKLNLRVKRFSRKGMIRQKYLRQKQRKDKWRAKFQKSENRSSACFICGNEGHWAKKCPGRFSRQNMMKSKDTEVPAKTVPLADIPVRKVNVEQLKIGASIINHFEGSRVSEEPKTPIKPIFSDEQSWEDENGDKLVTNILKSKFGLKLFRDGQLAAIRNVLCGNSTLLMMPTGGGKSLCYQLPAMIYQNQRPGTIALIISPLISLMEDQLSNLPSSLAGAHLNSSLTYAKREEILQDARDGKLAFLLISPEALVEHGKFSSRSSLPPISFVCIDEVHCLADWSHHFRPSYLRVCHALRIEFEVKCFLGLTATCTQRTMTRLAAMLGVDEGRCIRSHPLPRNLNLSVSLYVNKDEDLIELLQSPRMVNARGVIIYCSTRDLTERVASYVRTAMKALEDSDLDGQKAKIKRKKATWTAEAYHAGLFSSQRSKLQRQFIRGTLRVLVATIAFGMGLDKTDVDAVIHYNPPKSYENYVQEVGRAGRDGHVAQCHVFMDSKPDTLNELKRHVYSNSVDRIALKKLTRSLFTSCECRSFEDCRGHLKGVHIEEMTLKLDVREETIATILCYLSRYSFNDQPLLSLGRTAMQICRFHCYKGGASFREATFKSLALAVVYQSKFIMPESILEVDIIELCDKFGWNYDAIRNEFASLEWKSDKNGPKKTGMKIEFDSKSWLTVVRGNINDEIHDRIIDYLSDKLDSLERDSIANLTSLHHSFQSVAFPHVKECLDCDNTETLSRSKFLTSSVVQFFDDKLSYELCTSTELKGAVEDSIRSHIRSFISIYRHDHRLTGRAIACIFHGIGTPLFPVNVWGSVRRFWRSQLSVEWKLLRQWATEELVRV